MSYLDLLLRGLSSWGGTDKGWKAEDGLFLGES